MSRDLIQQEIIDSLVIRCMDYFSLVLGLGKTKLGIDIIKREKPKRYYG